MVIAESVPPNNSQWAADHTGIAAIAWRQTTDSLSCTFLEAGEGFVAVRWEEMVMVGVYISPNQNCAQYRRRLRPVEECIRKYISSPFIVAGDFNVHSGL